MASFVYDEFNDGSIGAQWTVDNGIGGSITESGGELVIATGSGKVNNSFWQPTWANQAGITGDFDIMCRMTVDTINANYHQGGILIRLTDNSWLKLCLLHDSGKDGDVVVFCSIRTNGTGNSRSYRYATRGQNRSQPQSWGGNYYIYFRIKRVGDKIHSFYSGAKNGNIENKGGFRWQYLKPRQDSLTTSSAVDIGLYGIDEGAGQTTFRFEWVREFTTGILPIEDEFSSIVSPWPGGNLTDDVYSDNGDTDADIPPYLKNWRYTHSDMFPWEHPPNLYSDGDIMWYDGGSGHQEMTWTGMVPSGVDFITSMTVVPDNDTSSEGWGMEIRIRSVTDSLKQIYFGVGVFAGQRRYRLRWFPGTPAQSSEILTSRSVQSFHTLELTRTGNVFTANVDIPGPTDVPAGTHDLDVHTRTALLAGDVIVSVNITAWGAGRESRPNGGINNITIGQIGQATPRLIVDGSWYFDREIWDAFNVGPRGFGEDHGGSHKQNYQVGTHTLHSGTGYHAQEAPFPSEADTCYLYQYVDDDFDVYTKLIFAGTQTWYDHYHCGLVFNIGADDWASIHMEGSFANNRSIIEHYALTAAVYSRTSFDPTTRKDTVWLRLKRDMADGLLRGFYSYTEPLEDSDWTERNPGTQLENWGTGKLGIFANDRDPGGGTQGPQFAVDYEFFRNWAEQPDDDPTEERETRACSTCPSGSGSGFDGLLLHFNEDPFIESSPLQSKTLSVSGVGGTGYFPGNAWIEVPEANVWQPEGDDFAADMRVSHRTTPIGTEVYASLYEDDDNRWHLRHINDGGGVNFLYRRNGTDVINLSGAGGRITDTLEHHVAVTQDDNTYRLYLDGTLIDSDSFIDESFYLVDSPLYIGAKDGTTDFFYGDMVNMRMTKGTSRWTQQSFIPMTSGYYETDRFTQLLLFTDPPELADESNSGLAVWNPGQVVWGNRDVGTRIVRFGDYCGYFPGTQDGVAPYAIQLADNVNWYLKDDDFTLDTWVHPLSHFNYAGIIHQNTRWYWYINSAGLLNWYIEDGPSTFSMQTVNQVPIDEWSHIALTRRNEQRPVVAPTFDPNAKGPFITLSNGDLTALYSSFANETAFSTDFAIAGGKWYFEVFCNNKSTSQYVGIAEISESGSGRRLGIEIPNSYSYRTDGFKYQDGQAPAAYGATWTNGNTIGVALDLDNGRIFFAKNNVWQGGGDPVVGTGAAFNINATAQYPGVTLNGGASSATIEFSSFTYTPPTGYESMAFAGGLKQIWRMYIKGINEKQKEQDFTIPNLNGPLWIGRGTSTLDLYHGYMDELRLLLGKAVFTDDEFWPYDYPYFDEPVGLYVPTYRRRIHSIKGR